MRNKKIIPVSFLKHIPLCHNKEVKIINEITSLKYDKEKNKWKVTIIKHKLSIIKHKLLNCTKTNCSLRKQCGFFNDWTEILNYNETKIERILKQCDFQ